MKHFRSSYSIVLLLAHCTAFFPSHVFFQPHLLKRMNSGSKALPKNIKLDFPIFDQSSKDDYSFIYLDSAASSQKPTCVIEAMDYFYRNRYSNVHRSGHLLGRKATEDFENARKEVSTFIGASRPEEIVFTSGATDAINLVVNTWAVQNLRKGDEVVLSVAEHHSNIVPWQMLASRTGCVIKFIQLDSTTRLDVQHFKSLLGPRTKLVSIAHVSNVLGAINPVSEVMICSVLFIVTVFTWYNRYMQVHIYMSC